jgi:hypothetical protein
MHLASDYETKGELKTIKKNDVFSSCCIGGKSASNNCCKKAIAETQDNATTKANISNKTVCNVSNQPDKTKFSTRSGHGSRVKI